MKGPSGIMHLKLCTKAQQAETKDVPVRAEMERLERANSYIKDEPAQIDFFIRNENRIGVLKKQLDAMDVSGEEAPIA